MTHLALTLPVSRRETLLDYVSRLAARNYCPDMWCFCEDTGQHFPSLASGTDDAIAQVCTLAGLPADSFDGRVVIKTSTMKYRLGGEVLNTETLSRGAIRFCPACVAEALSTGVPEWEVIHEMHWQFIHIRRCWCHGIRLQTHKTEMREAARFDFAAFLRDTYSPAVDGGSKPSETADELDIYLTKRAYGEHDENWCNCLEIPALMKACEAFGVLIDHGRDMWASSLGPERRRDAMLTGFQTLSRGSDGIRQALDRFNSRTPTRGGNQPHPSNGEVQRLLGSFCKMRSDLDPLRDIVREYFLDHYPFRPGTTVLGQKISESRVYSIRAACREIGIRRSLLEKVLIRRGLACRDREGQFLQQSPLSNVLVADLRREKFSYLDQKQTAEFLGCSFAMFKQLQLSGILRPTDGKERWGRKGFYRPALQSFLDQLGADSVRVDVSEPRLCTLDIATRKAKCSVPDIARLVLDGRLCIKKRLTEELRLDTLLVDVGNAIRALGPGEPNGYSMMNVKCRLFINDKTLRWLIANRYLDVRRMRHSITRVTRDYVTAESFDRFDRDYVTTGKLASEIGTTASFAYHALRKSEERPISDAQGVRMIYRRKVIQSFDAKLSSKI